MNAKLLAPLIRDLVFNGKFNTEDVQLFVQTGLDLGLSESTVLAIIEFYQGLHHSNTKNRIILLHPLIRSLIGKNGISEPNANFIIEIAAPMTLSREAVRAIIALEVGAKTNATARGITLLSNLLNELIKIDALTDDNTNYIIDRAQELQISPSVSQALLKIESGIHAREASSLARFSNLVSVLHTDGKISDQDRKILVMKAQEAGLTEEIILSLIELEFADISGFDFSPLDLITRLIQGLLASNMMTPENREYINRWGTKLNLDNATINLLIDIETAINNKEVRLADQLLGGLMKQLGQNSISVAESAFIAQKLIEIQTAEKAALAIEKVKKLVNERVPGSAGIVQPVFETHIVTIKNIQTGEVKAASQQLTIQEKAVEPAAKSSRHLLTEETIYTFSQSDFDIRQVRLYSSMAAFHHMILYNTRDNFGGTRQFMIINERDVDVSNVDEFLMSDSGERFAYKIKDKGKELVVVDHSRQIPFDAVGNIIFSKDSRNFAYIGVNERRYYAVRNGKIGKAYAAIQQLCFNPATHQLVYGAYEPRTWSIVIDEQPITTTYEAIGDFTFSNDGRQFAYWGVEKQKFYPNINGKQGGSYQGIGNFLFSPNGQRVAFQANLNNRMCAVIDGNNGPLGDNISDMTFSPDSKSYGYVLHEGNQMSLVLNDNKNQSFKMIQRFAFSADGQHYGYQADTGKGKVVILDGNVGINYDDITRFMFAPYGEGYVYVGYQDKNWILVQDGKTSSAPYSLIDSVIYSPNGSSLAYVANIRGKWAGVVRDGVQSQNYINPRYLVFNKDGSKLAFVARSRQGWMFMVNDEVINETMYTDILSPIQYDAQKDCFYFLARINENILLVVYEIE